MKTTLDESTLPFAAVVELSAGLRNKQFSASELTRFFAKRLETIGPKYNALALPLTKEAEKAAKQADREAKLDRFRSVLHGVPYGAKDLFSVANFPTTWGAKPFADQIFDYNATV